ncbi:MAG: FHA domain-containing protein [Lachnospiraceae bacterium]|nr:FHA domain-containing protein [Lachnospiraceae bacterium]
MILVLIIGIAAASVLLVFLLLRAAEQARQDRCYAAALKVIKENSLNDALRNRTKQVKAGRKLMVYLEWRDAAKAGYVFDPDRNVRIGRIPELNEIAIRNGSVSKQHCVLFTYQDRVYLRDLNSRNGTFLKRRFSRRRVLESVPVLTGDRICVGGTEIRVRIFSFELTDM